MKIINIGLSQSIGFIIEKNPSEVLKSSKDGKYIISFRENETTVRGYLYENIEDRDSDYITLSTILSNQNSIKPDTRSIVRAIKTNHVGAMVSRGWEYTYWAFDIHSTIIKPNYEAGNIPREFYPLAKECLQVISSRPEIKMMTYTCSFPHEQLEYVEFFKENGINFDFVNNNPEVKSEEGGYGYYKDKPYFNVLFEDKAGFNGETDWVDVKEVLIELGYWN